MKTSARPMPRITDESFIVRLTARIRKTNGCWLWTGPTSPAGYGYQWLIGNGLVLVHRASWAIWRGGLRAGDVVCHKCDVPACVNPSHLFVGTQGDNMKDCARKGRIRLPMLSGHLHPMAKLSTSAVESARQRAAAGESNAAIARSLGVSRTAISRLVLRKSWNNN